MPDNRRFSRQSSYGAPVSFAPLPIPDFQQDINRQLSFLNTMQAMERRAAGGSGSSLRGEDGLTPYQRMQREDKLRKEQQKAAEAEAKKNVMVGMHPVTGQPMIYRNESGQSLTEKDRERIRQSMLQDELSKTVRSDEELNRINGELYGPTPISAHRREELNKQARARTKVLGAQLGVDDKMAFDTVYGRSKEMLKEQKATLDNDSFLSTAWAGAKMGANAFWDAFRAPWVSDAQRIENARKTREENEAIRAASPTLTERALREQENQRLGRDEGYTDVAGTNLPSNIAASTAEVLTSFAPAMGVGLVAAPITGGASILGVPAATVATAGAMGALGAGMNMAGQAARAEADPNLTEEQKQQAVSYSDPGFVSTAVAGGLTGALIPGGVTGGITRWAGHRAAALGAQAGAKGIGGRLIAAGEKSAARAAAPRSLGTLGRDVITNSAENAGIMAGNTVAANMAYNVSTGKPMMENVTEGVKEAAAEGAILGVPFGAMHTLRRNTPAARAVAPTAAGDDGTPPPTTKANESVWKPEAIKDSAFTSWATKLSNAVSKSADSTKADPLIAEYLRSGGQLNDLVEHLPQWRRGFINKRATNLAEVLKPWEEAEKHGTLSEKVNGFGTEGEGESGLATFMGKLNTERASRAAEQSAGANSAVETNTPAGTERSTTGSTDEAGESGAANQSGRTSRPTAQDDGTPKADAAATAQPGGDTGQQAVKPADAGSPRPSSVEASDGTRIVTITPVGRNGSKGNADTAGGGEQSVSWRIIPPDHADAITANNKARETFENTALGVKYVRIGNEWYKIEKAKDKNGKEITRRSKADSATRKILNSVVKEDAKSTNPKGEVKESRFLPRQQYSSAGTSRRQIPESFKKIPWARGTRNLDIGAGAFELGTEYLRSQGVESVPFDPYNRARDVNNAALDTLRNGEKYDTVTVANLLNVVQEPEIRDNIIKQAAHSVKPDGKAYFQVYESDRSGVGRQTKTGGTDDNWQNARTLKSYQPDIERHFGKVESKDGMLIASEPKDPGPVEWQLNRAGDTVREQRGFHGGADFDTFNLDYAGSGEGGSAHGWGAYAALEKTSPFSLDDSAKKSHTRGKDTAKKYRAKMPEYDTATVVLKGKRWNINEEDVVEAPDGIDPDGSTIAAILAIHRAKGDITQARSALEHEGQKLSKDIQELQQEIRTAPNDSFRENLSNMLYYDEIFLRENQRAYDLLKNLDTVEYKLQEHRGRVYTVEVPEFDVLLHEDLPMSKQPKKVRESVQKLLSDDSQDMFMRTGLEYVLKDDMRGASFYNRLVYYLGSKEEASYLLNHYGIEGIYAFGRNDGPIAVVFNDKAIQILNKEARILRGETLAPEVVKAYLKTPNERKLAERLNDTSKDSPEYPGLLKQFVDTMLRKFKGVKNRELAYDEEIKQQIPEAFGWYDSNTQRIGMNPERIYAEGITAVEALRNMSHEIGHDVLDTRVPRSVRSAIAEDAYNTATTNMRGIIDDAYADYTPAQRGEEIFVETASRENPFFDPEEIGSTPVEYAEDMLNLAFDGLGSGSEDSLVASRYLMHFLATNAPEDIGTFDTIAIPAFLSNKSVVDAFTNLDAQATGVMQMLASDYRAKAAEAGVPLNKETMTSYLSAVLDPRTEMDVYARTTKLC